MAAVPSGDLLEGTVLVLLLQPDVVLARPLEGGLIIGGHVLMLVLHDDEPRLCLWIDEVGGGSKGATAALVDDYGATTGAPLERRLHGLDLNVG